MNDDRRRDDGYDDEPLEFVNREDEFGDEESTDEEFVAEEWDDEAEDEIVEAPASAVGAMARPVGGTGQKRGGGLVLGAAAVVVVALAAWVFWPHGSGLPEGVGELTSAVVLTDSMATPMPEAAAVRSSDVNLGLEVPAIVPEQARAAAEETAEPVRRETATARTTTSAAGAPGPDGAWFVQVGAFGDAANAARLADELRGRGFRLDTPTTVNSAGKTLTLVRIGYFETRNAADAWLSAHPEAFKDKPVIAHR
jgi:cell division septation protein DedD